jgi:hypothetical protein
MKKRLLYIFIFLMATSAIKTYAQSFDYDVTTADPAVGAFPTVTQGGITLTTTAPVAVDGAYKMLNINSNSFEVVLTSSTDIRQAIYFLRGAGNSSTATPVVTFGTSSSDPNIQTATAQSATATVPGIPLQYNFPVGTKYVRIVRNATVRLYRITAGSSAYTLPLDFLSFTAKPDAFGKTVALNWSTTNEVNTKNFEIQRRTDGTDFVTINTLPSKNTTGVHNYSLTDNNAVSGNSYYRIIQFDNDGASTISNIQAVTNKATTANLSIYPNPTTGALNVSHSAAGARAIARVVNMDGKTVFQQALSLSATDTKMDVSQLTAGGYLLILDNQNQKSSLKFIKQ